MPGRGPAPKPDGQRRRRNPPRIAPVSVRNDGGIRGPGLPEGQDWPAATVSWWETWRRSAQAATFTDTDWDFLLDTALLHAALWLGDVKAASELRLRVAKFGASPEDRLRLHLQVDAEVEAADQRRRGMDSGRRDRLLKVVTDGGSGA